MQSSQVVDTPLAPPAPDRTLRRIEPTTGILLPNFREMWEYKELLYYMLWRDVKSRYKQTFLGPMWAIIRPLITVIQMTLIFHTVAGVRTPGVAYPLFSFVGITMMGYFSSCVTGSAASLVGSAGLASKSYFPRLFIPLAAVTAPLIDLALSMPIFVVMMVRYHQPPGFHMLAMPFFLLLGMLGGLAVGLWLAPMMVRFRDIAFTLPFLLSVWFYATPIVYPVSKFKEKVPARWHWIIDYNPMTGVVEGFRWASLGGKQPNWGSLMPSILVMLALLVTGFINFRRGERTFVDSL